MAVKGVFASDRNITGNRKGDFASALLQNFPTGSAPLFALSSGMESADARDTVVTWFEENHLSGRIKVTNNASTGTSIVVDDASGAIAGQIYLSEASGEHIYVESVSGSTLTVTRGFAGTSVVAIDGSSVTKPIQLIGTAFEEGSTRPTAITNLGFPRFNYTQIFRNAWDLTGTAQATEYYTGDQTAKSKADCALFHGEAIERSVLFGKKFIGVKNGKPFRTMDGVLSQITTNVTPADSETSWDEMDLFLEGIFSRNIKGKPNERIAFGGNQALRVVNQIARNYGITQIQPGVTEFGMKVNKWMTPYGDISIVTHPLMVESPLWTKDLYVLHPGAIRMRYLRRTENKEYPRSEGVDSDYGVMTTELCIEYKAETTGGKFTGLTAADRPIWKTEAVV